jgi:hypothetical protein
MKRCTDCLQKLRNSAPACDNCGRACEPLPDRARLFSTVVDSVLKEVTERNLSASEDELLTTVEVLLALNQSPVYKEWLSTLSQDPVSSAVSSAILVGWALREEVETNLWEALPRVSDNRYTALLREAAENIGTN